MASPKIGGQPEVDQDQNGHRDLEKDKDDKRAGFSQQTKITQTFYIPKKNKLQDWPLAVF